MAVKVGLGAAWSVTVRHGWVWRSGLGWDSPVLVIRGGLGEVCCVRATLGLSGRSGFVSARLAAEWLGGRGGARLGAARFVRVGRSRRERLGPLSSGMSGLGKQRLVQRSVRGIVPLTTNKEGERDVRISEEGTSAHC